MHKMFSWLLKHMCVFVTTVVIFLLNFIFSYKFSVLCIIKKAMCSQNFFILCCIGKHFEHLSRWIFVHQPAHLVARMQPSPFGETVVPLPRPEGRGRGDDELCKLAGGQMPSGPLPFGDGGRRGIAAMPGCNRKPVDIRPGCSTLLQQPGQVQAGRRANALPEGGIAKLCRAAIEDLWTYVHRLLRVAAAAWTSAGTSLALA